MGSQFKCKLKYIFICLLVSRHENLCVVSLNVNQSSAHPQIKYILIRLLVYRTVTFNLKLLSVHLPAFIHSLKHDN